MKGAKTTQTLTEMKTLMAAHGLHPKHRHGQHFLHDAHYLDTIIGQAAITSGDLVLEVGPGTGVLSVPLLEAGARILAVEIDKDFVALLTDVTRPYGKRFTLLVGDVLQSKHRISQQVIEVLRGTTPSCPDVIPPFQLVANLPYTVATPLIANLVCDWPQMTQAVVTVQREMADRLTAMVGSSHYGPLTIGVQAMCHVCRVTDVPASCFWPIPKVESSIVRIRRRDTPLTSDPARLANVARRLFAQRRKQLGTIVRLQYPGRTLPEMFNPLMRPQELELAQVIALAETLGPPPSSSSDRVASPPQGH